MSHKKYSVYRVFNLVDDKFYIGSTCQTIAKRLLRHKSYAKEDKCKHCRFYEHMNTVGWDNARIECLEESTAEELKVRENYHIKRFIGNENLLNMRRATRTPEEVRQYKNERQRKYYERNKEPIKSKMREQYRDRNIHKKS